MKNVSDALCYIHKLRIAHHDIKPSNMYLDEYKKLKLADFILSRNYSESSMSTLYNGSLQYLAPEVLESIQYDPFKADIWSFGISFYQLVVHKHPFSGSTKSDLLKSIQRGPKSLPHSISPIISIIIMNCLNIDPNARPSAQKISKMLGSVSYFDKKVLSNELERPIPWSKSQKTHISLIKASTCVITYKLFNKYSVNKNKTIYKFCLARRTILVLLLIRSPTLLRNRVR